MNSFYKIAFALSVLFLFSCKKNEPPAVQVQTPVIVVIPEVTDSLHDLKTYINRIKYPNFKFGAALSLSDYNNKGVMYKMVNQNFDEIALGYEMKHGAVVQANGNLALDNVNNLLVNARAAGMSVYGHTLVWHANQNASYLNSLLTPLVVTTPAVANDLNIAGPQSGNFNGGWAPANTGSGISIEDNQGLGANSKAIKLSSSANSSTAEGLQLISPDIKIIPGNKYEVICYIKSDVPGEGRLSFEGLNNNTPKSDWTKTGTVKETFTTSGYWKAIRIQISDFTGNTFKIHFDLGYKPNVNYYIDVNNLYVYNTQNGPLIKNLIANGDFESGEGWGGWGNGSTRGITAEGMGAGNKGKAFYVTNPSKTNDYWVVQTAYDLPEPVNNGELYNLSFWVKGTAEGIIRPELQSPDYSSNGFGQVAVTKEWKLVQISTTLTAATRGKFVISYGEFAGTVYIDDVVLSSSKATGGTTTTVNRTLIEKESIISGAMETWISGMVTQCKPFVKAWDVVNEPMDDGKPAELKTGVGRASIASDEFFWQDYLGKDYAVKAFKLARQNGNATDLLFINDYNLEYSLDKCRGLIAYVAYIESKGAKVDGIGTQMHISTNADKDKIAEMFKLLAATGKQIKISELDIGVGVKTTAATPDNYKAQAEMYKYVIDKYFELIPAAQRYGITIWSPLDSPANSSWRAGEPIGLWTESYVRKLAYAAVAKALEQNTK